MEHFHYRNKCQIGHFFMNFHYARYENVKKSVPPKFKNEASDHLKNKNVAQVWPSIVKVEIFLEQREVAFLSPSKICENLNFSTEIQIFGNFAG